MTLEEQIKWLLKEDRRTLGLALRAKESNMTLEELNKKFILIAKEYIDNNK